MRPRSWLSPTTDHELPARVHGHSFWHHAPFRHLRVVQSAGVHRTYSMATAILVGPSSRLRSLSATFPGISHQSEGDHATDGQGHAYLPQAASVRT